jgi:hypothetical protein
MPYRDEHAASFRTSRRKVYDPSGRVREVTLAPQEGRTRIASLIVKTKSGNHVLPFSAISSIAATTKTFHDRTPVGLPDSVWIAATLASIVRQ